MQPLYSVDHETRQNSNRVENTTPQEDTPLLHHFPPAPQERGLFMTLMVTLLLFILITGVIIGVYLLVLQNNAENIIPPVSMPLQLVSYNQWSGGRAAPPASRGKAAALVLVQTDTAQCSDTASCESLLRALQASYSSTEVLPYNFLVSSSGETYAARGWRRPSPLLPARDDALVLAFIGNFTESAPARAQIDETKNFIAEAVSQQHLDANYQISGKAVVYEPTGLFDALKSLPRWNGILLV